MDPLTITPVEFELEVKRIIEEEGVGLNNFRTKHLEKIPGIDGDYVIDVTATFDALGADFKVLIECKRHKDPISRDYVQILKDKVNSTGAHKGMLFSTSTFKSGAVKYAETHGIALIEIKDGKTSYHTKAYTPKKHYPEWLPNTVGILVTSDGLMLLGNYFPPEFRVDNQGNLKKYFS